MAFDVRLAAACLATAALGLASAPAARADVIYDATGGNPAFQGFDPINTFTGVGPVAADRFVAPFTGTISTVELNLALSGEPGAGFSVDVFADAGAAGPGAALGTLGGGVVSDASLTTSFMLYTYTPDAPIDVTAGQSYYVGVLDLGSAAELANTLDPAVIDRPTVLLGATYYNNGGVQANAGAPYQILVDALPSPVPEPSSIAAFAGLVMLGLARRRGASQA